MIDITSSRSLTSDIPDIPCLLIVEGRYQNWIKPVILFEALGVPWDPVVLDREAAAADWFRKIHPQLYVPALIDKADGGRVQLWDSTTILIYLGQHYDTAKQFVGKSSQEDVEIGNWLMFETASLGPTAKYWVWYDMRTGADVNQKAQDKMMTDLRKQYSILNQRLSEPGQNWIALKDRPTIADISILPFTDHNTLGRMQVDIQEWPALAGWYKRMMELPYVKKAYDELESRPAKKIV
ncbi:Glutathione S-transferase gliG [Lasiodiplodia hormozganensis]|uniref:glutathione transferase n=1 Tax=Lasiodiplodia hormozganensis TaxID=869390 RepID=A0AA40CI28_9PEZI|nr:Glutathione S-transferase gliG [Lasiodiplodia hormozganensis]